MSSLLERVRELLRGLSAPSYGPCGGGDPSVWEREAKERRRASCERAEDAPVATEQNKVTSARAVASQDVTVVVSK